MRPAILLIALSLSFAAHGQVYKCVDSEGRTTFSNVTCADPEGESEEVRVQVNRLGTFATQEQIEQHQHEMQSPSQRQRTRVTVVHDSSTEDPSTLGGIVNRNLRIRDERLQEARDANPGPVTVVRDSGRESQLEKAVRIRHEERLYNDKAGAPASQAPQRQPLPEIDDREVHYKMGQAPLDRRLQQIENKVNDPRPQDVSRAACVDKKPSRGIVRVGREELWPGMTTQEVRRKIGRPDSVNSILVGREQWVYREPGGGSLYIYTQGLCVESIQ